jgi:hypothetical protein
VIQPTPTPSIHLPYDLTNYDEFTIPGLLSAIKSDIVLTDRFFFPRAPRLFGFQNAALVDLEHYDFTVFEAIRGASKTYVTARYVAAEGVRNTIKVVHVAPTYRQAQLGFDYVYDHFQKNVRSGLPCDLGVEIVGYQRGSKSSTLELSNGTIFKALPMGVSGEKIRGERANILWYDEAYQLERSMFTDHLLPFLQGHVPEGTVGPKMIFTTSAEYQDSYCYHVITNTIIPKIIAERELPYDQRKYWIIDVNVDDIRASGYRFDEDVSALQLEGASQEEKARLLYNKWVGVSGQFLPGDIFERIKSNEISIERQAEPGFTYGLTVDIATQQKGDLFVIHVFKFMNDRPKMAFVNSFWTTGLTADEMAWKIHEYNAMFNPAYILMDKGGGGLFVADSLTKRKLVLSDGSEKSVEVPILLHNETRMLSGQRILILNRPSDEMIRSAFADDRSRGGEAINQEDILVHMINDGLRQALMNQEVPFMMPATYDPEAGVGDDSDTEIWERMKESILQLRLLTVKIIEHPDGTKEIVKTKASKVPQYVWKHAVKDGGVAFTYAYILYRIHYRSFRAELNQMATPRGVATTELVRAKLSGLEHDAGQLFIPKI